MGVFQVALHVIDGGLRGKSRMNIVLSWKATPEKQGSGFRYDHNLFADLAPHQIGRGCFAATRTARKDNSSTCGFRLVHYFSVASDFAGPTCGDLGTRPPQRKNKSLLITRADFVGVIVITVGEFHNRQSGKLVTKFVNSFY